MSKAFTRMLYFSLAWQDMIDTLWQIITGFRVQDAFDVALIALLIYGVLLLFERAASRFVMGGIALLGLVYMAARFFHMYMTAVVLQSFFTILLVALVIIFQEELRRFFEVLATFGRFGGHRKAHVVSMEADIISQAVSNLAEKRVGAIIVVPGGQPLVRHLIGGESLDGKLSTLVLESLFDHHSPGHDGAIVIRGGKIVGFGYHLPLSNNPENLSFGGLRHTAALGLAERTDALAVVVSEETGVISVAKDSRIRRLMDANELKDVLDAFFQPLVKPKKNRRLAGWLKKNTKEKITALVIASLLWISFGQQRDSIEKDFVLPIEYRNLPVEWVLEDTDFNETRVRLKGPQQAFRLADPEAMKVTIDLSTLQEGKQEVVLSKDLVKVPPNLSLESIKPDTIPITLHRLYPTPIPIEIVTVGSVPDGYTLVSISARPEAVAILASRDNDAQKNIKITTEPLNLAALERTTVLSPSLVYPAALRFTNGNPPDVSVSVIIQTPPPKPTPPPPKPQAIPSPAEPEPLTVTTSSTDGDVGPENTMAAEKPPSSEEEAKTPEDIEEEFYED